MRFKALQLKFLTRFALLVLFFVGQIPFFDIYAQENYSCTLEVEPTTIRAGGSVKVKSNNVTLNNNKVSEPISGGQGVYYLRISDNRNLNRDQNVAITNGVLTETKYPQSNNTGYFVEGGDSYVVELNRFNAAFGGSNDHEVCKGPVVNTYPEKCEIGVKITKPSGNSNTTVNIGVTVDTKKLKAHTTYRVRVYKNGEVLSGPADENWNEMVMREVDPATVSFVKTKSSSAYEVGGQYTVYVTEATGIGEGVNRNQCSTTFTYPPLDQIPTESCSENDPREACYPAPSELEAVELTSPYKDFCRQAGSQFYNECLKCMGNTEDNGGSGSLWTAFGCVPVKTPTGFLTSLVRIGIGMAGGFALLLILYGAFQMTTSAGDPQKLQGGQEVVVSAIIGLIFIILSVVIFQFIGVNILGIPGLT